MTESTLSNTEEVGETGENEQGEKETKDILYPPENKEEEGEKGSNENKNEDGKEEKDTEKKEEETKEADKEEQGEKDEKKEGDNKPEVVLADDLTFPEGVKVDEGVKDKFLNLVNSDDMSKAEKAQAIIDLQQELNVAALQAHEDIVNGWEGEAKADKEISGPTGDNLKENLAISKKGMKALNIDGLENFLDETGFGSHPKIVKVFLKVGKAISNDALVFGGPGGGHRKKEAKEILYPNDMGS